jgi:hypothetical protein
MLSRGRGDGHGARGRGWIQRKNTGSKKGGRTRAPAPSWRCSGRLGRRATQPRRPPPSPPPHPWPPSRCSARGCPGIRVRRGRCSAWPAPGRTRSVPQTAGPVGRGGERGGSRQAGRERWGSGVGALGEARQQERATSHDGSTARPAANHACCQPRHNSRARATQHRQASERAAGRKRRMRQEPGLACSRRRSPCCASTSFCRLA